MFSAGACREFGIFVDSVLLSDFVMLRGEKADLNFVLLGSPTP